MYDYYVVEKKHYIWILEIVFLLKKFIQITSKFRDIGRKC